jgi:hypothetical protein
MFGYQSLLLKIGTDGKAAFVDIGFTPKTPVYKARIRKGREKWEVDPAKK